MEEMRSQVCSMFVALREKGEDCNYYRDNKCRKKDVVADSMYNNSIKIDNLKRKVMIMIRLRNVPAERIET